MRAVAGDGLARFRNTSRQVITAQRFAKQVDVFAEENPHDSWLRRIVLDSFIPSLVFQANPVGCTFPFQGSDRNGQTATGSLQILTPLPLSVPSSFPPLRHTVPHLQTSWDGSLSITATAPRLLPQRAALVRTLCAAHMPGVCVCSLRMLTAVAFVPAGCITRREGYRGILKGGAASVLSDVLSFSLTENRSFNEQRRIRGSKLWNYSLFGVGFLIRHVLDTVAIRMATESTPEYATIASSVRSIVSTDGWLGLLQGLDVSIVDTFFISNGVLGESGYMVYTLFVSPFLMPGTPSLACVTRAAPPTCCGRTPIRGMLVQPGANPSASGTAMRAGAPGGVLAGVTALRGVIRSGKYLPALAAALPWIGLYLMTSGVA